MTAQTDRELLELAAKAAGYTLEWGDNYIVDGDNIDCTDLPYVKSGQQDEADWHWNPLDDDGDALRLAVKLGIKIELHPSWVYARAVIPNDPFSWREITEGWGITGEPLAATRRAIVRAAAAIATSKEGA